MHYFTYGPHIAAVENADQAAKYATAGWCPVSRDEFVDAWWERDKKALANLKPTRMTAPLATQKAGAVIERLSNGWTRYSV